MAQLPRGIRKHTSRAGYEVRITASDPQTGSSRRFSTYAKSLSEAKEKLREMENRTRQALLPLDSSISLAKWVEEWIREVLPHKELANSTKELYKGLLATHVISASIGQVKVSALQSLRMEKFFKAELGEASASLRRNVYAALSHVFRDAVRTSLIATSPLRDVARPKSLKQEARFISQDDLTRLLESLQASRHIEVFNLILQTGLRRGEVLALSWSDVDLKNSRIHVNASLSSQKKRGAVKTSKSQRTLDLNPTAVSILKRQRASLALEKLSLGSLHSPTPWEPVFTTESGAPVCPRALLRTLQNAAAKAGLGSSADKGSIGIHTLRHFVATKLLTSGVDLLVVSRILGHDSIQTTVDIYGHMEDSTRKQALALLA